MRVSDLLPPLPARAISPPPARGTPAGAAVPGFDAAMATGPSLRIGADLEPGSRGLSVEQHAARVLDHLIAGPAGPA